MPRLPCMSCQLSQAIFTRHTHLPEHILAGFFLWETIPRPVTGLSFIFHSYLAIDYRVELKQPVREQLTLPLPLMVK